MNLSKNDWYGRISIYFIKVLQLMSHVKWDVKDIKSQHNSYVDFLLQVLASMSFYLLFF